MGNKKQKADADKKRRMNGIRFSLDGIPPEEISTLKLGVKRNPLGIEMELRTDKRKIETDFITGYQRDPKPSKPGFNLKHTNVVSNSTLTTVEQNIANKDFLIAIDTNTKVIRGQKVHKAFVAEIIEMTVTPAGKFINPKFRYHADYTLVGEYEKPELVNWKTLIEDFFKFNGYDLKVKVGLIVDSELDNIPAYNKRQKPIVDNFLLPLTFELMYASADTQNDSVLNQAIAYCDKAATQFLNAIEQHN
jgi:hypothetical protein